jgi:hypothetical protein
MKSSEQDYDARLYFKSMLNRLKIMGGHISISTILGTKFKKTFIKVSICPPFKKPF